MLFGRAPSKENIPLSESEAYLDRCFDGELKRLSVRMPEIEAGLTNSFTTFEKAIRGFSKTDVAPNMQYLYGLKETYLKSQKANYSSSLIHALSPSPQYSGSCLYLRAKSMLESYSSFITDVMKVNNTFRLAMIGYSGELADVKRSFTAMERLCKELGNELEMCSHENDKYKKIKSKINAMLGSVSEIAELKESPGTNTFNISPDENALEAIQKRLEEGERRCELSRHRHHEADSALVHLLLPLERASRKHDHMSASKRKLTEYIKDPPGLIRTADDITIIHRHLSEIADEIRTGKIDAKNSAGLVSQIDAIRGSDLLALAESSRKAAIELKNSEAEVSELRIQLLALEKRKMDVQRAAAEKAGTEQEIGLKSARLSAEKKETEQLFLSYYRKQVEIML